MASGRAPAAPDWLSSGSAGGARGWVPLGRQQTTGRRGRREPSSQWTRGPRAVTKGRSEAAAAAGEVGRGKVCRGEAAAGPGRKRWRRDHGGGARCSASRAAPPRAGRCGDAGPGDDG